MYYIKPACFFVSKKGFFAFSKKYLNSVDKNMRECYLNSRKVLALRYKEC